MPIEMKVYTPTTKAAVAEDDATGQVHARFLVGPGTAIEIVLTPAVLGELTERLVAHCAVHAEAVARAGIRGAAVRTIAAHHRPGMLTLRYEIEAGLTIETSIEPPEARRLLTELQQALAAFEANPPPAAPH